MLDHGCQSSRQQRPGWNPHPSYRNCSVPGNIVGNSAGSNGNLALLADLLADEGNRFICTSALGLQSDLLIKNGLPAGDLALLVTHSYANHIKASVLFLAQLKLAVGIALVVTVHYDFENRIFI